MDERVREDASGRRQVGRIAGSGVTHLPRRRRAVRPPATVPPTPNTPLP